MIIHAIHGLDVNKIKVKRIDHTVIRNSIGLVC